jgi:hypothetical protein
VKVNAPIALVLGEGETAGEEMPKPPAAPAAPAAQAPSPGADAPTSP